MTDKFPLPWRIEQTDPEAWAVVDANGCKLFYISADDPEDDKHPTPGDPEGPTVLGYSEAEQALYDQLQRLFGNGDDYGQSG